jgi:thioredoxin 1
MKEINESNIDEVKSGYSFVDFWATWCGPCKMMSPVFEKVSQLSEYSSVKFYKNNVDDFPIFARENEIQSIPTLIMFLDGKEQFRLVGAIPEKKLIEELNKFLIK